MENNSSKELSEMEHTSTDTLQPLSSVSCELDYRQAQDDDEVEISMWDKGYSEDEIAGCEIVTWPESQDVMERDGYRDHCWLINDEEGLDLYGSSAYVVEKCWHQSKTE